MKIGLAKKLWATRYQFFKYATTGAIGVCVDLVTLYCLKEFVGLKPVFAVVINQIIVLSYIFFLNKYWSFESKGESGRQAIKFLTVAFGNYLFAIGWMYLFNERLGYNYLAVRLVNIALSVSWNFLLYRGFVYKNSKSARAMCIKRINH
jgi:putative flippase GtrA